jgi:hypothetical protein
MMLDIYEVQDESSPGQNGLYIKSEREPITSNDKEKALLLEA